MAKFLKGKWIWVASVLIARTALAEPGSFTLRIPDEPQTLDWNRAHTSIETYILMNIMEGLVSFDTKPGATGIGIKPALAQSWSVSPDGKTYTFKLRPNVVWSDGVKLKASDFVYSWRRLLSPLTAANEANILFDIEGAKDFNSGKTSDPSRVGIKALDDQTLQVKLTQPRPYWIYIPTFWVTFPLRRDLVEKYGEGWTTPGRIATLGPYQLALHDLDKQYVFVPNPQYYGKHGNIRKFTALIVKDNAEAMRLYKEGKLDFLDAIGTADLKFLAGSPDLKVFPYLKTEFLGFVTNQYPADTPQLRRAIAMAIDKSELKKILYASKPATSYVSPPLLGYSDTLGLPFDPAKAKAELSTLGLDLQSTKLTLAFLDWEHEQLIASFVQNQLKKNLGLVVDLAPMKNKNFRLGLELHSYPIFLTHWGADYPDPSNYLSYFTENGGNTAVSWHDGQFESLLDSGQQTMDAKKRKEIYLKAQKILLEDQAVVIPLSYEPLITLVKSRVQGLVVNPLGYLYLANVWVEPDSAKNSALRTNSSGRK